MIRPLDLTDDLVWSMFQASNAGDLDQVKTLIAKVPHLVRCEYNYTPPLHFAVREGHLELVRFLVNLGADFASYRTYPFQDSLVTMAQDREHHEVAQFLLELLARRFPVMDGIADFLEAAQQGDLPRIQGALARNADLARGSNDIGQTALHEAAAGGHVALVQALLSAGADADAVRADGRKPIHCALNGRNGNASRGGVVAGILLGRGAAYNIYLAAVFGDSTYVRESLAHNPALSNFEDSCHRRPLSAAAGRNDLEMVELLLAHGANPSLPEEGAPLGQALWTAVYRQQTKMARALLEHGANPNTAPESSGPALMHARNHPELKRLLIEYGARQDRSPTKRLETLISDNALTKVEQLLKKNPRLPQEAFWGEGILAGPANRGSREMIELLIRHGAGVPEVSKWGPEYYFKHEEIAALLLQRGMNPNHMNWHRFTLLHHMAAIGDAAKAILLLDHGARIDAVDEEYRSTPLGCAARWGRHAIVSLLLERGADPNLAGAPWATPLAWARKKKQLEIEAALQNAMQM